MQIEFAEESENELVKRKCLYLDPKSEMSLLLSKIQDLIESEGFTIDRSRYKYVHGQLCKFNIELIDEIDPVLLTKRSNTVKKLSLNIDKLKWEFGSRTFSLKIGKIQEKNLFITVAFLAKELDENERNQIKNIKDSVLKSLPGVKSDRSELLKKPVISENTIEPPTSEPLITQPLSQPSSLSNIPSKKVISRQPLVKPTNSPSLQTLRNSGVAPKPIPSIVVNHTPVVKSVSMFKIRG
jgi:hypothetical protein